MRAHARGRPGPACAGGAELEDCQLTPHAGSALAHAAGGLPALRALSLWGNSQFGNAGAVALAGAGTAPPALCTLDARCMGLSGGSGVIAIATAWHKQLVCLDLNSNQAFGGGDAAALAQADWPALRYLGLANCSLQNEGFQQLMQATGMRMLQTLNVFDNGLHSASLEALAGAFEAGRLPELQALCLGINDFDDEQSLSALARAAPHLWALHTLELGYCNVGRAMLEALAGAALPALDTLLLDGNAEIDNGGLQVITGAPYAKQLRTLSVFGCDVSDDDLRDALPSFPRLDTLIVGGMGGSLLGRMPGWVYDPE